jgi:quinol monooxygenase YgiN
MLVQVVTFNLDGLSDADFRVACERDWAQRVAAMPGLVSKTWLANTDENTYAGIYVWQDDAAMQRYAQTDFFQTFANDPRIVNIRSHAFDVMEAASRVTNGLAPVAA